MNSLKDVSQEFNDEDYSSLSLQPNDNKVPKAVEFLSLPEVRHIPNDSFKSKFLKSRGLNLDEITEAFTRHYAIRGASTNHSSPSHLILRPNSNEHSDDGTVAVVRQNRSTLSKFFSFCQKLVLFAGIASSFYYVYQKWARAKDAKKKTEKNMRDEINHLRNEVTKLSQELRKYQLLECNHANLLKEVNSLKAIFVGRQNFEEKQTGKVALPSWQLNGIGTSKPDVAPISNTSKTSECAAVVNGSSCQIDEVVESTPVTKTNDKIPVTVSLPSEDDLHLEKKSTTNEVESKSEVVLHPNSHTVKNTKKITSKSNGENEPKRKSDKKN